MHPNSPMPELPLTDPIIQFTILVTAALAVQLTVERAHMPGVHGLLVLGVLLGPAGAQVLAEGPVVPMLGQIGLIYVMFIAGLEIDLRIVREHRAAVAAFGLLAFLLSAVPAAGGGLLFGMGDRNLFDRVRLTARPASRIGAQPMDVGAARSA
jgi:Kef-type K+ transport system membrane component KefB